MLASPGARAFYDEQRQKLEQNDTLRRLADRLVGILRGGLKTCTLYDEARPGATARNSGETDRMI
jgi:hypothetical protein